MCVFILKNYQVSGGYIIYNYTYHACIIWLYDIGRIIIDKIYLSYYFNKK